MNEVYLTNLKQMSLSRDKKNSSPNNFYFNISDSPWYSYRIIEPYKNFSKTLFIFNCGFQ